MRNRLIVIVVALILGGLAAVMAAQYLNSARRTIEAESELVEVVVAQEDLPQGVSAELLIEQGSLSKEEIPRRFVAAGAVSSFDAIEGQVLAEPVTQGEQVTHSRFQFPSRIGLAHSVPDDFVAVSFPTDKVRGVAGMIKPGDHVAVIGTYETDAGDEYEWSPLTKVIVPKARVLALDTDVGVTAEEPADEGGVVGEDAEGARTITPTTITLALSPRDAERVVFSHEAGKVWLALLPAEGLEIPESGGVDLPGALDW